MARNSDIHTTLLMAAQVVRRAALVSMDFARQSPCPALFNRPMVSPRRTTTIFIDSSRKSHTFTMSRKSKKTKPNTPLVDNLSNEPTVVMYRELHKASQPYKHAVFYPLCDQEVMRNVHEEAKNNMRATFKETDLFKLFQTADFGNLQDGDPLAAKMPELMNLRSKIYSKDFRDFIQKVTGCRELTDRVDCSMNAYATGCHLMCHDDVIGTRCISYIIYLTDPDDDWNPEDGGALELYPLDTRPGLSVYNEESKSLQGIPESAPTVNVMPKFNSMALFAVQPGCSYHAVQEVYAEDKPRLSISGWYHTTEPPVGSDLASLSQIMSKGDAEVEFTPIEGEVYSSLKEEEEDDDKDLTLSEEDRVYLSRWINPVYLQAKSIAKVQKTFLKDSSIQLASFLAEDVIKALVDQVQKVDDADGLGVSRVPSGYELGAEAGSGWEVRGPPHKQRFLALSDGTIETTSCSSRLGQTMKDVRESLFKSEQFSRFLYILTHMKPTSRRGEVRRFRPGLDYTVAHYGTMVEESRLDATLCVCSVKDEDEAEAWESGDVGGFECYIEADADADAAATAEVYRANNDDDDTELLSIQAGCNVLNIVLRDKGVMRFIKYVSNRAPSSRCDITMEFEVEQNDDDDDDDLAAIDEGSEEDSEDEEDEDF